jgi:hypothetical protein
LADALSCGQYFFIPLPASPRYCDHIQGDTYLIPESILLFHRFQSSIEYGKEVISQFLGYNFRIQEFAYVRLVNDELVVYALIARVLVYLVDPAKDRKLRQHGFDHLAQLRAGNFIQILQTS